MQRPLQAVKTSGERERVEALLRFYRPRQRVRLGRGDFYVGKSCFPEKESFPCDFCLCCVAARTKIGESGVGFCGFARAKLPQLKLKFETRRPAGEMRPRPPACQEYFFGSLRRPSCGGRFCHAQFCALEKNTCVFPTPRRQEYIQKIAPEEEEA